MSPEDPDRDLARLFEEQQRADASLAPAFSELLARPRRHSLGARMTWRPALTAATVLVVVAAAALLLRRPHERSAPDSELLATASALADWKSPTDSLLQTPGADLLNRVPVLVHPALETTPVVLDNKRS